MYILAYDFGTGGVEASLYGADGVGEWPAFSILDAITHANAEVAPRNRVLCVPQGMLA